MKRVLLVNNHKQLESVMKTLLELKGFESRCTQSSCDFVKIITDYDPEVIILNLMMANSDSYEICQNIRLIDSANRIKLILFGTENYFTKRLKSIHVNGFLSSPFAVDDLITLLN